MRAGPTLKVLLALSYIYLWGLLIYVALRAFAGDSVWWLALVNTFSIYLLVPLPLVLGISLWQRRFSLAIATGVALFGAAYWLSPYFLPKLGGAPTKGAELQVLSYNMRADPEGLEPFLSGQRADVVFIQENAQAYALGGVASLLELYPYQFSQEEAWGNMVLSRLPILESADLDGFGSSLPQRVVVEVEGQAVALYNVHLTWPIGAPRVRTGLPFELGAFTRYDDSARNTQVERLLELTRADPLPFLVVGDFNLSATSPTYEKVKREWQDAFINAGRGLGHSWPTRLDLGLKVIPLLRIDYVWHSDAFTAVQAEVHPALASDHFPLSATLALRN